VSERSALARWPIAPGAPIVFTMGDACGIGPEVIARLYRHEAPRDAVVVGDFGVMRRAVACTGGLLPVVPLDRLADLAEVPPNCLPVLAPPGLPGDLLDAGMGRIDARAGAAAAACIRHAVDLVRAGEAAGLVTAPIHKEALAVAGVDYPGHTEMLQALATGPDGLPPVRMMLANESLRVVLVTVHLSLRRAIDALSLPLVLETLRITHDSGPLWGCPSPRIAVAGLNPHAGEGGLFGDEEQRLIAPAVLAACREGIDAHGPFAPDTVFMRARDAAGHPGEFDVVVAMTHDHGLIPVKYLGIEQGVNLTLGLPFVRTSPDHGTAFDLAGGGQADPASLEAAFRMARRLLVAQGWRR
jgi:4-hydroxythreonine-4-phosphate dehydrogenase